MSIIYKRKILGSYVASGFFWPVHTFNIFAKFTNKESCYILFVYMYVCVYCTSDIIINKRCMESKISNNSIIFRLKIVIISS